MNELVKKHGFLFVLFFSNWAILLHILYYLNILPCTYSIALFVFIVGSCIMLLNYILYPKFLTDKKYMIYNVLSHAIHIIPFVVFVYYNTTQFRYDVLLISVLIYFLHTLIILNINPIVLYFNIPFYLK